jgi:hypothetical protein
MFFLNINIYGLFIKHYILTIEQNGKKQIAIKIRSTTIGLKYRFYLISKTDFERRVSIYKGGIVSAER